MTARKIRPARQRETAIALAGKREFASRALCSLGLAGALGTLRSSLVGDLRVLAYHRVLPALDEAAYAFDPELVSARAEEFDWQMAYVARRFSPVSCEQVADAINTGKRLPKSAVMVTFDDGFSDNYEVAFPILRRHAVPALFFLSTGYIGTDRVFWFDWLVYVLLRTTAGEIRLDDLGLTIDLGASVADRRAAALKFLRALKRTPESLRLQVLDRLDQAAGVVLSAADKWQSTAMTWEHVREMSAAGMEFGSHTVSHPILSTITDPAALREELEVSKATIERETGRPSIALAYPVGGRNAYDSRVVDAVARAGYQFAFSYERGVNGLAARDRYHLKRLRVERDTTRNLFRTLLELPEMFGRP